MDIENQIIEVTINNFNINHFLSIGYIVKSGDKIKIPAKDLPKGSGLKIWVECSYCGNKFKKAWRRYLETKDDLCCSDCKKHKIMKISLEKYGNICSLRNPKILSKSKKTNLEKYGVEFPLQSYEIREKCIKTRESNPYDDIVNTSKTQRYLAKLYNGELNKHIDKFFVDIFLEKDNIAIEYDGTGHDLCIKKYHYSTEEYIKKEKDRENIIMKNGIKLFRIKYLDEKDSLPSDSEMLYYLEDAKKMFDNGYKKYTIDLKTKIKTVSK